VSARRAARTLAAGGVCHICRRDLARTGRSGSLYCRLCNALVNPGGGRRNEGRHLTARRYGRATTYEERLRAARALHREMRGFGVGWGRRRPQVIPAELVDRYRDEPE
jgi:hypothetical protein